MDESATEDEPGDSNEMEIGQHNFVNDTNNERTNESLKSTINQMSLSILTKIELILNNEIQTYPDFNSKSGKKLFTNEQHLRSHSNEGCFMCEMCGEEFCSQTNLQQQQAVMHPALPVTSEERALSQQASTDPVGESNAPETVSLSTPNEFYSPDTSMESTVLCDDTLTMDRMQDESLFSWDACDYEEIERNFPADGVKHRSQAEDAMTYPSNVIDLESLFENVDIDMPDEVVEQVREKCTVQTDQNVAENDPDGNNNNKKEMVATNERRNGLPEKSIKFSKMGSSATLPGAAANRRCSGHKYLAKINSAGEKVWKWKCDTCQITFKSKSTHYYHKNIHRVWNGTSKFKCPACQKQFPSRRNQKRHLKSNHVNKHFWCEDCDKWLESKGYIQWGQVFIPKTGCLRCQMCSNKNATRAGELSSICPFAFLLDTPEQRPPSLSPSQTPPPPELTLEVVPNAIYSYFDDCIIVESGVSSEPLAPVLTPQQSKLSSGSRDNKGISSYFTAIGPTNVSRDDNAVTASSNVWEPELILLSDSDEDLLSEPEGNDWEETVSKSSANVPNKKSLNAKPLQSFDTPDKVTDQVKDKDLMEQNIVTANESEDSNESNQENLINKANDESLNKSNNPTVKNVEDERIKAFANKFSVRQVTQLLSIFNNDVPLYPDFF